MSSEKKEILTNEIGVSEDVANFAINLTEKNCIWVANQLKKQPSLFFNKKLEIARIIEWEKQSDENLLEELNFKQAYKKAKNFVSKCEALKSCQKIEFPNSSMMNYRWVKLEYKSSIIAEGRKMKNCLRESGTAEYYMSNSSLFSLRDWNGKPHVTMEITKGSRLIKSIYGAANSRVKDKYVKHIALFLINNKNKWNTISSDYLLDKIYKYSIDNNLYGLIKKLNKSKNIFD